MLGLFYYYIFSIFFIVSTTTVETKNETLIVPLNKTTSLLNKELYGQFVNLNSSSTLQIGFVNASSTISFIIFQVHSNFYNVTVYNNTSTRSSTVYGTNVGMYSSVMSIKNTFFVHNQNAFDVKVYITIHGYGVSDPIPGGCNMEFQPPISPNLYTSYTKDYILVEAASAKDSADTSCTSIDKVEVVFYLMYLPERHFDTDTYFKGICDMLTLDNISENGVVTCILCSMNLLTVDRTEEPLILFLLPNSSVQTNVTFSTLKGAVTNEITVVPQTTWRMRRMLGAYPGTGAIYVAVAYNALNRSAYSVYVPTYSYGCSPMNESSCELLDDALSHLLCASLLFFGLFLCYFGHRFFKTEMFLIGLLSGVIITYILLSLMVDLERPALLGAAVISGFFFGAIWLLFWWFYGIPVLSVLLSTLNLGFLFAALMYFGLPGGFLLLQVDIQFWTLFVFIMTFTSLMLLSMTFLSNILCCTILGAYAAIYPIDYYAGSNLKYIINNTIRRAVVPKFNSAVLSPPFQWTDAFVMLLWLTLATTGFLFQHYQNRLKPPFPPPPRSVRQTMPGGIYGATGQIRAGGIFQRQRPPARALNENTPLLF